MIDLLCQIFLVGAGICGSSFWAILLGGMLSERDAETWSDYVKNTAGMATWFVVLNWPWFVWYHFN